MLDYPKMRNGLEAVPVEHQGRRLVLLRDGMGYAHDSLLIPLHLAALLAQMNGQNSLRDLQAHYLRITGSLLFMENLQDFVNKLDENLFLENDRFLQIVAKERNDFYQDPIRRMHHGGRSYPLDPPLLRSQLESFFSGISKGTEESSTEGKRLVGLMAPHIDLTAGGVCFAHAYQAVRATDAPATWVILGTGHEPVENCFALTLKDFETPLGLMPCDREYGNKLRQRASRNLLASEYLHRKEHTIEFQAVFLSYVQPSARIVPLLCSFSLEDWERDRLYIDEFAGLLRGLAKEGNGTVGFLASVDLAHIGPRYGDLFEPHSGTVREHLDADRELLKSLADCDPQRFMHHLGQGRNRRRVCGMAPLYILAKILEGLAEGKLLEHTHAVVDNRSSFVTFASMAFYAKTDEWLVTSAW
jgi:MEMO1 family protein